MDINDVYKDFEQHIEFIKNSIKNNDYFNMKDIKPLRRLYKKINFFKVLKILNKLSVLDYTTLFRWELLDNEKSD